MRVRAASDPVWAIFFDPGSGRLYTSKSVKLLLRPFRPGHKDEITPIPRLANFEGGAGFQYNHIATFRLPHDMLPRTRRSGVLRPKISDGPQLTV
jgi:hypothetical protein